MDDCMNEGKESKCKVGEGVGGERHARCTGGKRRGY